MATVLTGARYIYLKQNEDGSRILEKRRFMRGDDLSDLPKDEVQRLLDLGMAEEKSEQDTSEEATYDAEQDTPPGGSPEGSEGQDGATDGQDDGTGSDESEPDEWEDMSYPDLQQAAKSRDLNAGGSTADLQARLREYEKARQSE